MISTEHSSARPEQPRPRRSPTNPGPSSVPGISDEVDDIELLIKRATDNAIAAAERRFRLQVQAEVEAAKSAELTMAERKVDKVNKQLIEAEQSIRDADARARKGKTVGIAGGASSIVMLAVLALALKYLRGMISGDIADATSTAFEERAETIEDHAKVVDKRVETIENNVEDLHDDMTELTRAVNAMLARELDDPDAKPKPKKTR